MLEGFIIGFVCVGIMMLSCFAILSTVETIKDLLNYTFHFKKFMSTLVLDIILIGIIIYVVIL